MEGIFFHGLPLRHFIPKFVGNCPCTRQLKLCSLKRNFQVSMETTNFHALKTLFLLVLLGSPLMVKIQLEPCRGLREKLWTKKVGRRIIITRIRAIASNSQVTRRVPLATPITTLKNCLYQRCPYLWRNARNFVKILKNQSSVTFGFHGNRS